MTAKYIIPFALGTCALSFALDHVISDRKLFGGKLCLFISILFVIVFSCSLSTQVAAAAAAAAVINLIQAVFLETGSTPGTVSNKEWAEETERKLQAWPRTAGPPVVMNPISRQNFIVKSRVES
ncbi:hypothetical protein LOK49_LG12G02821 [Camellia lanceoleosa]|uniref:Uncharacterized protein n=1 Tax=Camellia lanceoleosa TaxID=1840588 RepID=A0ACC0FVZ9_9ERIC|nr:hypothetical protein LOK49_LG12G02821 [Camellia lanceoleosa]